ncbi:MAG: glycoside hydrolase family 15 protein [Chloroflexi bacterium]|nr:glycoside hydrolase family 15 protein [Chloroflexota bacterium]
MSTAAATTSMTDPQDIAPRGPSDYLPISAYALIGDCQTAALVARDGSIDWYCPRRFDAPAVFCRLLDAPKGGYLQVAPVGNASMQRHYRGPTNVLETTYTTGGGSVKMTDCMAVRLRRSDFADNDIVSTHRVLRCIEGLSGTVELEVAFKPTFGYAASRTDVSLESDSVVTARTRGSSLTLHCPSTQLRVQAGTATGMLQVHAGEQHWVVLTEGRTAATREDPSHWTAQLQTTLDYWQRWAEQCTYTGRYQEAVLRSALTLKLLTYEPTGAVVAAPTTSLPEAIGGERNWDYRYTWLRDSADILDALMSIGHDAAAADFMRWLEHALGSEPTQQPQIMYGVRGERDLRETTIDLEGYRSSRPVRVGNGAVDQTQLDVYGEVLLAAYVHYGRGTTDSGTYRERRPSAEAWTVLRRLVEQAAQRWTEPGNGIWEVRGGLQHFLYGRLMCWAALDRGLRLAEEHNLPAPVADWQHTRERIRGSILDQGYDEKLGAFTQAVGSDALDACALVIPIVGFLPASDARVSSTIETIRQQLTRQGLVYRYRTHDGLAGGEGTFTMCTFWLVNALARVGRVDEARALFEQLLGYANDVGLLSEEIDPDARALLGNFPQGFSHLALINAAMQLERASRLSQNGVN